MGFVPGTLCLLIDISRSGSRREKPIAIPSRFRELGEFESRESLQEGAEI